MKTDARGTLIYRASYKFEGDPRLGRVCLAEVLDFPGAITFGYTLEEAREMLVDALQLMAEGAIDDGLPLPVPNPNLSDPQADVEEPITLSLARSPAS